MHTPETNIENLFNTEVIKGIDWQAQSGATLNLAQAFAQAILDGVRPARDRLIAQSEAALTADQDDHEDGEDDIKVVAYMHATHDRCVSTEAHTYAKARELVFLGDVTDRLDWLEKGMGEWRYLALQGVKLAKLLHATPLTVDASQAQSALRAAKDMGKELAYYPG